MTLYFAYGSNLNVDHMQRLCPKARMIGPYYLHDYRLVFRHFADIEPAIGDMVAGGLWRVTAECRDALDRYEGVDGDLYRRVYLEICAPDTDKLETALTYRMTGGEYSAPHRSYLAMIANGYRAFGLDMDCLDEAVEHALKQ